MDRQEAKWRFPLSDYGEIKGINDAGVETFTVNTLRSLVRESIQNSLDARREGCVARVVFEESTTKLDDIPGVDDLRLALLLCKVEASNQGTKDAEQFFDRALQAASKSTVRTMRVSDYGTTGLRGAKDCVTGSRWSRLVKETGSSGKSATSGGSFGIGKYSSFACSEFRTVFFSSSSDDGIESHIGVSRLISYKPQDSDKHTTGVGYYSDSKKNVAIMGQLDMAPFVKRDPGDYGTDVLIPGFKCEGDITKEIIKHVVVEFLVAIWKGMLAVTVNGISIDASNLGSFVSQLNSQDSDDAVRETIEHYDMLTSTDDDSVRIIEFKPEQCRYKAKNFQFGWKEGDCWLWLKKGGTNLNRQVTYTRAIGMRIWNQKNISGSIRFTGILMIEGEKMNEDFKKIEGPSHEGWAVGHADDEKRAERMLKQIKSWVIDRVIESFQVSIEDEMEAYGTALYLPKREAEDSGKQEEESESLDHVLTEVTQRDMTPKRNEREIALKMGLTPDDSGDAIVHSNGKKKGKTPRRGVPGGDASGFAYVNVKQRLICTNRDLGEYRLTFTVPHNAKKVRIALSTVGEIGPEAIRIQSASARVGDSDRITYEENQLVLESVKADESATITFKTGFPRYCMMGADYYEAN